MNEDLDDILRARREQYEQAPLDVADVDPDPVVQVRRWTAEWSEVAPASPPPRCWPPPGPTAGPRPATSSCAPSTSEGCAFFTNYESRKGRHLAENGHAALLFSWVPVQRQIELLGPVGEAAARPRAMRTSPRAPRQPDRSVGLRPVDGAARPSRARGAASTRPRRGSATDPSPARRTGAATASSRSTIELWQGRPNRLHDRLRYTRAPEQPAGWRLERLSP